MNKYKNKKCEYQGIKFDSKDEMEYYFELLNQKEWGIITHIQLQPRFELIPKFEYQGKKRQKTEYVADFMILTKHNERIVIDIKGFSTPVALLKRKMFEQKYPDIELQWIAKSIKYGIDGFINYDDLKKIRAKNKKEKAL
jgi:hypothetical protein